MWSSEKRGGACFSPKNVSIFYALLLNLDDREKLKRKTKKKSREKGRKRSLGGFMFSLQITSQSHSLHLGNSPACFGSGGTAGGERKKRGKGMGAAS